MNVQLLTMSREEAIRKLKEYKNTRRRRAEKEFREATQVYEQLAEGAALFNLNDAITRGGLTEEWHPRLAVARADRKLVFFCWAARENWARYDSRADARWLRWSNHNDQLVIAVDMSRHHEAKTENIMLHTKVPMIPANVDYTGNLRDYWILWEVEEWTERPRTSTPPQDPYLIKRLCGDIWAIVAEWDLTEVERMVMRNRNT